MDRLLILIAACAVACGNVEAPTPPVEVNVTSCEFFELETSACQVYANGEICHGVVLQGDGMELYWEQHLGMVSAQMTNPGVGDILLTEAIWWGYELPPPEYVYWIENDGWTAINAVMPSFRLVWAANGRVQYVSQPLTCEVREKTAVPHPSRDWRHGQF